MKFKNPLTYTNHFRTLVQFEREEQARFHKDEIEKISGKKREKRGRALLDMLGKFEGRGLGGTYLVKFMRMNRSYLGDHEFSIGDLLIATRDPKPSGREAQGTLVQKTSHFLVVAYAQRPPAYHFKGGIRLDLYSNDLTFQRMLLALKRFKYRPELQSLLLERRKPLMNEKFKLEFSNQKLNASQQDAVRGSLCAKELYLIHGPPGTGKTTTLVESIVQHLKFVSRVLVTADSNTAVDTVLEKLVEQNVKVVRIGNPARISEKLIDYSLDVLVQSESFYKEAQVLWRDVEQLRKEQDEHAAIPSQFLRKGLSDRQIRRLAKKRRSARGVPAPLIRKMARWINVQEQVTGLIRKAQALEQLAVEAVLEKATVVCSTNVSSGSELLENFVKKKGCSFDVLFVDEASQAVEPSVLIPMMYCKKYILAGDHKQLPPTVMSEKAKALEETLFERLIGRYSSLCSTMLCVQYRMHDSIMAFPNAEFYEGLLRSHKSVSDATLFDLLSPQEIVREESWLREVLDPMKPCIFLDTSSLKAFESQRGGSTSRQNEKELELVENLVRDFESWGLRGEDMGIISPYDDQVELIRKRLEDVSSLEVKSVDGFQGREKELIVVSFVRANNTEQIGFLRDFRRLNVAITRAKKKLILIGHRKTLEKDDLFKKLFSTVPSTLASE